MTTSTSALSVTSASRSSQPPVSIPGSAHPDQERGKRMIPEMATHEMAAALPHLPDDDLVGVEVDHVVVRDGQPDLKFRGTLLASVASDSARTGRWRELRVYRTAAGKKVFFEIGRSILDGERDKFEARVFDPMEGTQWSVGPGGKLVSFGPLKYKTDEARAQAEKTAITDFFKFTDLAKKLYAKLGAATEESID
jgi:hypothetical protein